MDLIFNAFNQTPFEKVKVVILWQDPYHWKWQAHWLCFSVQEWISPPPSLKNIFKEIESDIWTSPQPYPLKEKKQILKWDLTKWTKQWVLLLNAILTVKDWKPASHSKIWWENFTDEVIRTISYKKEWIIFLLWWNFAKSKKSLIDTSKHYILEAQHPSPFSAHNWFFWCKHFSKTNEILIKLEKDEIDWKI
jgi:uracil-DNA glycosylase